MLSNETTRNHKSVLKALGNLTQDRSIEQLDVVMLKGRRATLKLSPLTTLKCVDSVRAFFRFCVENVSVGERCGPAAGTQSDADVTPTMQRTRDG